MWRNADSRVSDPQSGVPIRLRLALPRPRLPLQTPSFIGPPAVHRRAFATPLAGAVRRSLLALVLVLGLVVALGAADARAAVTYRASSGNTAVATGTGFYPFCSASTASASMSIPSGTVDGDVMIASVSAVLDIDTAPAGWTEIAGSAANGTQKVFSKVFRTGDAATVAWTSQAVAPPLFSACNVRTAIAVTIDTYTGNDTTEPLTPLAPPAVFSSGTALTAPGDTAYEPGSLRVSTIGALEGSATQTSSTWTGLTAGSASRGVVNGTTNVHVLTGWEAVGAGATGTRTATATRSVSGAMAYTVVIRPRHAQQLGFTTQPVGGVAEGVALPTQPVVAVQYGDGVTATDNTSAVTLTKASGPAAGILTCSSGLTVSAVAGAASFSGCQITGTKAIGTYTIKATSGATSTSTAKKEATSTTFTIIAGPGAKMTFTTDPVGNVPENTNFATQPRVTVLDAYDNVADADTGDVTLSLDSGPPTGVLGCTNNPKAAVSGLATFAGCKITGPVAAGTYTLRAHRSGLTDDVSASFTITHGTATKLAFQTQPGDAPEGSSLAPQPAVVIQDVDGNPVKTGTGATKSVTITKLTGPATGVFACTTNPRTASTGVATFSGCRVTGDNGAGTYTISATSSGLSSVTSDPFLITPAAADRLVFTTQPVGGVPEGVDLPTQPVVVVQDMYKNVVTSDTGDVTLTRASGPATGVVSCSSNPKAASSGVATFSGCQITGQRAAGSYTLQASRSGLTAGVSSSFTITYGAPTSLRFSTQPVGGVSENVDLSTQPAVVVTDAYDNIVGNDTSTVTLEIASGPSSGILTCTGGLGKAAVSGMSTFAGCRITGTAAAGTYTVKATDGALTPQTSTSFVITPGPPTAVEFSTQPVGNVPEATALPTQPVGRIRDAYANTVTSSTATVTLSIFSGPAPGVLSCTGGLGKAAVAGVATFAGCQITGTAAAGTYVLRGASSGLTAANADPFTIIAGAPTRLVFTTQPVGNVPEGTDLPTQPVVSVHDAFSNVVPDATTGVLLSIASGPGSGLLNCSVNPRSAVAGVATFAGCQITGSAAAGTYVLVASGGGLATANSSSFVIRVGASAKLAFATQPTGGVAPDTLLPTQPAVAIQDAYENVVTTDASTITLAAGSGPGGRSSCRANAVAATSGLATFSGCRITGAPGTYTLAATTGSLTAATSLPISILPGSMVLAASSYAYPPVTLNGFDRTMTSTLPLRIADTTGAEAGWRVSVAASAWTGGTKGTLVSSQELLTPPAPTCDAGIGTCDLANPSGVAWPISLTPTATVVYRATGGTGMGAQTMNVPTRVVVPGNTTGLGAFTQDVTVTIAAGP